MKNYLITVNGTQYEVQVEELDESVAAPQRVAAPKPVQPVSAPVQKAAPAPAPKAAAPSAAGKVTIKAPMPGTIVKINVAVGDTVKTGAVLCVFEAMKMENEIRSPQDGVIASINTSKGATINSGDVLLSLS